VKLELKMAEGEKEMQENLSIADLLVLVDDIDRKVARELTRCWATVPDTGVDDSGRGHRCYNVAMFDSDYCAEHQGEEPL
jgi:hypothetical protein